MNISGNNSFYGYQNNLTRQTIQNSVANGNEGETKFDKEPTIKEPTTPGGPGSQPAMIGWWNIFTRIGFDFGWGVNSPNIKETKYYA